MEVYPRIPPSSHATPRPCHGIAGAAGRYHVGVTTSPDSAANPPPHEHYFSAHPLANENELQIHRVALAGQDVEVVTAPGVFSYEHVDQGTHVLLNAVEPLDAADGGAVLDLGCGWGPITLAMALELRNSDRPDVSVWAVDVNERALGLARRNAERHNLTQIRAVLPEQVPADLHFDTIWSNPPIRIGKPALHALLTTWLTRLTIGGSAHLVVAKHLGADSLQSWLALQLAAGLVGATPTEIIFGTVTRTATSKGFRVLSVIRTA